MTNIAGLELCKDEEDGMVVMVRDQELADLFDDFLVGRERIGPVKFEGGTTVFYLGGDVTPEGARKLCLEFGQEALPG
jgi:hypothetical protein